VLIRLGTRGSALARAQTLGIARRLEERGFATEITIIRTQGDRDQTRRFSEIGSPGLFVREIEQALVDRRVDLAVHSYKDLPSRGPEELVVAAIPERRSPTDRLLVPEDKLDRSAGTIPLPRDATVGTASSRRRALLEELRPDLSVAPLRGNVPTRLGRLREGRFDAILLAAAGLDRLDEAAAAGGDPAPDRSGLVELDLDPETFVPAPSQGALALEVRADDTAVREAVEQLHDHDTALPVEAERRLLYLIQGGCEVPFGAWCRRLEDGRLELIAAIEWEDGMHRTRQIGDEPLTLAERAWEALQANAAGRRGGRG
jgi:hydroxymethylbilane synthase